MNVVIEFSKQSSGSSFPETVKCFFIFSKSVLKATFDLMIEIAFIYIYIIHFLCGQVYHFGMMIFHEIP